MSDTIDNAKLDRLEDIASHFIQRKARASERLKIASSNEICFALLGLHTNVAEFNLKPLISFRRVIEPPGEMELARAIRESALFGAIGRYSNLVTHELGIQTHGRNPQATLNIGWWFISALRIKTLADFLVPAYADYSWSVIAALDKGECTAALLEDVPQARRIDDGVVVSQQDFEWAAKSLVPIAELLKVPAFHVAVDALTTHPHLLSPRMMVASIWSGIEAILGVGTELRYRLSLSIAVLLEPRGPDRTRAYKTVMKMYDTRSKAVHGAKLSDSQLIDHLKAARRLLSVMVCGIVDRRHVPTQDDLERMLLE